MMLLATLGAVALSCTFPNVTIVAECNSDAECGDTGDPCRVTRCTMQTCVLEDRAVNLCPTAASPCERSTCVEGLCATIAVEQGSDCGDGICVNGSCVACRDEGDCSNTSDTCVDGFCAAGHCTDGEQNGGESDEDCGGGACPPCAAGRACTGSADCDDLGCVNMQCGACTNDSHCDGDTFCCLEGEGCGTAGSCRPRLELGVFCDSDAQCDSGRCIDGVCCDGACDGACQACVQAKTEQSSGRCADVLCGLTDGSCAGLSACDGAGECALLTNLSGC